MLGRTTQNDTMINSAQSIKYSCKKTGFTTFGMHGIHHICRPSSTLHRHEEQTYTKIYASRISDQCVLAINRYARCINLCVCLFFMPVQGATRSTDTVDSVHSECSKSGFLTTVFYALCAVYHCIVLRCTP